MTSGRGVDRGSRVYLVFCMQGFAVLPVLVQAALATSCTITQSVEPLPQEPPIASIAVENNPDVHMEAFQGEMESQLRALGLEVSSFDTIPPQGVDAVARFTANWSWDMAMYLTFFRLDVYRARDGEALDAVAVESNRLGSAEYDARGGGFNLGKFGGTADLIRPLLIELVTGVRPQPPPKPSRTRRR